MEFTIEREPTSKTINAIYQIAKDFTVDYFTANLPDDTKNDMLFQQVMYLQIDKEIISFIVFTCWDGSPHITLIATKRDWAGKGYGKALIKKFIEYIDSIGFHRIELYTVMPESKSIYVNTVSFYEGVGFKIEKVYSQLWESGAIKMVRTL